MVDSDLQGATNENFEGKTYYFSKGSALLIDL